MARPVISSLDELVVEPEPLTREVFEKMVAAFLTVLTEDLESEVFPEDDPGR